MEILDPWISFSFFFLASLILFTNPIMRPFLLSFFPSFVSFHLPCIAQFIHKFCQSFFLVYLSFLLLYLSLSLSFSFFQSTILDLYFSLLSVILFSEIGRRKHEGYSQTADSNLMSDLIKFHSRKKNPI